MELIEQLKTCILASMDAKNVTKSELARRMGKDRQFMTTFCNVKKRADIETIVCAMDALDLELSFSITGKKKNG